MTHEDLRYPIGPFEAPDPITPEQVTAWIDEIEHLPTALRSVVEPMSGAQLDTRYRRGGWTVRQVVHHVVDSHVNSYVRFKWALTEDRPTIKTYFEERWAELPDMVSFPVAGSLTLLEALHARWVDLLRGLSAADLQREFLHPDTGPVRLDRNVGLYAWHGRHHLAHITRLAEREGWA
jgi:hypothetical protein